MSKGDDRAQEEEWRNGRESQALEIGTLISCCDGI